MNNNWKQKLKKSMKRALAGFVGAAVLATSFPLPDPAFAQVNYEDLTKDKATIISKAPVTPAKLENGQAADLIQNPAQPAIYTLRTDYKVRKNQDWKINYQPYVASVGENATPEERAQVNKTINVPDLKGYDKPLKTKFDVTYDGVVKEAQKGSNQGVYWQKNKDVRYKPKDSVVKVKHVFQSLTDFNEYGLRDGEAEYKYTDSIGKTGNLLEVQALKGDAIRGFEAEADVLSTMVPEDTTDFEVEYRYNRKSYDVDYNTEGGTDVASRLLYYGQKIPGAEEPKKNGSIFLGWKPSCDLKGVVDNTEKTFKKNEIITNGAGNPIKDLKANLVMPAEDVVFTAVWKDAPKADYLIQFWTEKPDYDDKDDTLPLRDRYDYIGSKRVEKVDTGLRPDLTDLDIHGITFPDLNDERLEKAQNSKEEFERYYFLNKDLTQKQNASKENPNVQKSVLSTGETVYNVYYNRRVYTLYFTAANEGAFDLVGSFWPIITRDGKGIGKEGSPYKVDVRFNQSLDKIWPKDEEVSNLPPGSSDPEGDIGLIGWTINNNEGEQAYRDTPPYRLSAEDFIDSQDVVGTGEFEGFGHSDQIPIKDGETKKRDKYEISLGSTSYERSVVHHIDIIKDDFDGKEQIDYDKSYWKSDTSTVEYGFGLPHLQGFTLKEETRPAEWIGQKEGSVGNWDAYKTFDELNAERNKKTPFRSDADKIEYIDKFPWGTKSFNGVNAYNYANYTRNKYKLKLNNDPKNIKNDNEYTDGKDRIEVFYEMPLKDLNLEEKYVPEKPAWVPENWVFKGWTLDPAGENMVKGGNETKLHYDQFLFAKWGEPDHSWKVTVDPNGGEMKDLTVDDIIDRRVTVNRGDEVKDVAKKELDDGDKQIFTVKHRQRLQAPPRPERKGYNFLGWELVRQNKDGSEDTSFRRDYHVPELYAFSNDLVSHVYLRAIWVKNDRVDVPVHHHFIDSEGNEIKPPRDPFIIEDARVGYYTAATATEQDAEWILMPHEELEALADENSVKQQYMAYNALRKFNNADFHSLRVEALKVLHEGKEVDNPKAQNNVFHFYYRHFKTRNYKVNYLDERGREEMKEATTPEAKKEIVDKYSIIPQENVVSKNRHYDARNYRPIPGWKLVSDPQQQLFYDVDEKTGEFKGINGTGSDEITFYYKDVRVIEVPGDKEPPEGYVRITFKADKGGSFGKDAEGKPITELNYDVIKGLKSDLLPVPKLLEEGETADPNKHYITPDDGKTFTKWDKKPLLNDNTIIENEAPGYYVFTAQFEWSGVSAKGLVITEAFNDPANNWPNNFSPTVDKLKSQVVWREKDVETALPADATVKIVDEKDQTKELTDADVYEKVKEMGTPDKDELVRTVNFKAIVTFKDGRNTKELDIPVKVYKNVYEALNKAGDKPLFLKEAEGKEAKDGGLKDVTGDYVMVTVKASKDFNDKDDKIYYVNKNAWVEIPEVKTEGSSTFVNWTADKAAQNEGQAENGTFDFGKRHKFTENTVISPSDAKDVVEQTDPNNKPNVPNSYVKVIVKTTDKATDETAFEKTFWVNPTTEVAIDVTNPTGKTVAADATKPGTVGYKMDFFNWKSEETTPRTWKDKIVGKFEKETTIVAKYSVEFEKIKDPTPTTDTVHTPQGKIPTVDELKAKITPPEGKTIKEVKIVKDPDVQTPGDSKVQVVVEYTDGSSAGTNDNPIEIPVKVHEPIVKSNPDGSKPESALANYVKVTFKAGTGGSVSGDLVYYVSPEVEVDMTDSAKAVNKTPSVGYTANGGTWSPEIKAEKITAEKTYEFNFVKSKDIVEKTDDPNQVIPDGYVTVKFIAGENGEVVGGNKTYYVNPEANIKLVDKDKATQDATNELVVPEAKASKNYGFTGWVEEIDYTNPIKGDREYVAKFTLGQVTLTYDKGGEDVTGEVPKATTVNHGTTVRLAGPGNLAKPNSTFAGWKIGNDTYKAGDEVTLNENTTATAQWSAAKHNVVFDLAKGTIDGKTVKDSVKVDHGATVGTVTDPVREGYVFTGWKAGTEPFDPAATPVNSDVTLVAQWEKAVEKIGETDTVDENHFIKVIFKQGSHGQLVPAKDQTAETVTYKVAKDYTFDQAKANGLTIPGILPNKYYKAKVDKDGWDNELQFNKADITFTAQYEPIAEVIPVDPNVTPDDKLQEDKPEGMVLVEFVVDGEKAFMDATSKFYVVANKDVTITPPTVYNRPGADKFEGWEDVTLEEGLLKGNYTKDTKIYAKGMAIPEMKIQLPQAGDKIVYVIKDLNGATGKMEVTVNGQKELIEAETKTVKVRKGRRIVNETTVYFTLPSAAQSGDSISYWAEKDGIKSPVKDYTVK